jgi:Ino eighty subunit 1
LSLLTIVVFPEMRAQLRTYHSIPCLQARQDPNAYKQLQDAPRLKSILKGASEDKKEPTTIEAVMAQERFRTNPVNLIFVLSQQAVKVTEAHFTAPREFFDLITRTTLSSKSRANAFLWLMWWYLESNFTAEDAKNNPFGPGLSSEDGLSQTVPAFDYLDEDQANNENIDTEEEIAYGELKRLERIKIMEADAAAIAPTPKHRKKGEDHGSPADDARSSSRKGKKGFDPSDTDTRSASPPGRVGSDAPVSRPGRGRWIRDPATRSANTQRLILKTRMDQIHDGSSPVPPGSSHPILHTEGTGRRARPLTAHQQAVERNRAHRVDYILDRKMRKIYKTVGRKRHGEGAVWRAWMRHDAMLDPFVDSEDEGSVVKGASGPVRDQGFGGLMALEIEEDDYGEEISAFAASLRRSGRRLSRWDQLDAMGKGFGVMATTKTVTKSPKGREVFDEDGDKVEDLEDRDEEIDDDGTPDEMEVD